MTNQRSAGIRGMVSSLAVIAMFSVLPPLGVPTAGATDQQFILGVGEWSGPAGSLGVQIRGSEIWVDVNGDALENAGDTHHPIPGGITSSWRLSLSPALTPTNRRMIATLCGSGFATIRMYSIPSVDHASMTQFGGDQTLSTCLNPTMYFDPGPTAPYRTAVFREVSSTGYDAKYLFWDMVTGIAGVSGAAFHNVTGFIEFAPSGTMALVQHDLNGGADLDGKTDYTLVGLCPAQMGLASPSGKQFNGTLHAWFIPGTPGTIQYRDTGGGAQGGAPYNDCSSPPTGACCKPNGLCDPDVLEANCTGVWHPGQECADVVCAEAALQVGMTGPATVARGAPATYTLTAKNTGLLASSSVVVVDRLPVGSTFVSATSGGVYSISTDQVTWNLGTLAAGQQSVVTVTVQSCAGTSMVNLYYWITGSPGGTVSGTPPVPTTLTAPNTTGLTLTVLSSALDPTPLATGGRTRHTVRMVNSLATARNGLRFNLGAGALSKLLQVVNNGGGVATLTTTNLSWTGDLPASSTTDVVYDTDIKECRLDQPGTEVANNGATVYLRDVCGISFTYAIPTQSIAVAPSPFSAKLESPSHGPVQSWGSLNDNRMIVCRPGATVDLDLKMINVSNVIGPSANMSLTLPAELTAATNPPFLGTPPAGTLWDAGLHTISWTGQIPANGTLTISFRAVMSPTACSADLYAQGGFSNCNGFMSTDLSVAAVPRPPISHLLSLHGYDGLWYLDPSTSPVWKPLLCGTFESLKGFGMTPDSTIWVAGTPCFKLNPYKLSFQIFQPSFLTALGMDYVYDAAGDPRDTTVVYGGYLSGIGLRLRRYNPRTQVVTVILNSPATALGIANCVTVSNDGIIGVNNGNSVVRVDPANPSAYQQFIPPGGGQLGGLSLDTDGNWLTSGKPGGTGLPRPLENVNRQTGAYSSIVDVQSFFTWYVDMPAIATSPDRDVYVGSGDAVFGKVRRSAGNSVTTSTVPVTIVDLMWNGPAVASVDVPTSTGVEGSLTLLAPTPNPARATVRLSFMLPEAGRATLAVFDLGGRRVRTLADGAQQAGAHTVTWDGRSDAGSPLGAGLYFVKLQTHDGERLTKLVLAR